MKAKRGTYIYERAKETKYENRERLRKSGKGKKIRHTNMNQKMDEQSKEEQEITNEWKWEVSRFRGNEETKEIQVERIRSQQDLDWVSVSNASVGEAETGSQ